MNSVTIIDSTTDPRWEALAEAATLARHMRRPRYRRGFTILALQDAHACGGALLSHRRVGLGAALLDVLEVDLIAGHSEAARQALLAAAVQAAAQAEIPWLRVFQPAAAFAAYGLAACTLYTQLRLAHVQAPPSGPLLRTVTAADLDDLAALYHSSYALSALAEVRALPDWRWLLTGTGQIYGLEDSYGRLVGYALCAIQAGEVLLYEAAAADSGAARVLLQRIAQQLGSPQAELRIFLPPEHVLARAALHMGARLELRTAMANEATWLWGVVDPLAALRQLQPEYAVRLARSRYADWQGRLQLAWATQAAVLTLGGSQVAVEPSGGPVDVAIRQISLNGLAQLLLGYRDAADLRASDELRCADPDLGLIDTIFAPVHASTLYRAEDSALPAA